jgi:release factor glutamine methyltransferase
MHSFQTWEHRLATAGHANPRWAIEELAAHLLGCKPLEVYLRVLSLEQQTQLDVLVARAERGEPVQHLIGHVDFRGLEIRCDRRALIPRPETELLVEAILETQADRCAALRLADIGTGTGCIALALLAELPNATATGIDISHDALELAGENAQRLGLHHRFQTLENNLLEGFERDSLDLVVSNPPYIPTAICDTLEISVRAYEPRQALDGGPDGLALIRPLAEQALRVIRPGGGLFLEIGYDQGVAAKSCLQAAGFEQVSVQKDWAGLDRIVCGAVRS